MNDRLAFLAGWLIGCAALAIPALFGIIERRKRRHSGGSICNTTPEDQPTNDDLGRDKPALKKGS